MMKTSTRKQYENLPFLGKASDYLDDIVENIGEFDFLSMLNKQELTILSQHLNCYAAPKGYLLFEAGKPSDHIIIILSGSVSAFNTNDEHEVQWFSLGSTLGCDVFLDHHAWRHSCITKEPTDFAVLSRDELNEILMHSPRLGNQLLMAMMQSIVVKIRTIQDNEGNTPELVLS